MAPKIFVADDSVTIQKVIELAFADTGTVIQSATNGDAALDAILASRPDVVLADVCMPGMNGYEICRQIKLNPDLSHIPVVLLVGAFEPFDDSEASRVGYDARLTKPFDASELIDVVWSLVGENTTLQEADPETVAHSEKSAVIKNAIARNKTVRHAKIPVSERSLVSFLGSDRILDLIDEETVEKKDPGPVSSSAPIESVTEESSSSPRMHAITADQVSDEVLDKIAERVLEKMSTDVISEIAWEIVPELSEILIKRSIEENQKP